MRFDIIIPTINRPSLDAAVKSVRVQRHTDWRLFVVGDGVMPDIDSDSNDRIVVMSVGEAAQDSGASPRNLGIKIGDSPWIAYLDDDDVWYPDHLSNIVQLYEEYPSATIFKTAAQEMVMSRKSPRHKKEKLKLRCVNTDDPLTITLAHSRELFYKTNKWLDEPNHDHILFNEMLANGGVLAKTNNVTALFLR
jgi:glycosyltransferase involved in cell wall biosynthesis